MVLTRHYFWKPVEPEHDKLFGFVTVHQQKLKATGFQINLLTFASNEVWSADVNLELLHKLANHADFSNFDEYTFATQKALTGEWDSEYSLRVSNLQHDKLEISWTKRTADLTFTLGKISLERVSSSEAASIAASFVGFLYERVTELTKKCETLTSDNFRLSEDRDQALSEVDKLVTVKEKIEKNLMGQFLPILNAKKMRIQEIYDEMAEGSASNEGSPSKRARNFNVSDDDYDTDEENERAHSHAELRHGFAEQKSLANQASDSAASAVSIDDPLFRSVKKNTGATGITSAFIPVRTARRRDKEARLSKALASPTPPTVVASLQPQRRSGRLQQQHSSPASSDLFDKMQ